MTCIVGMIEKNKVYIGGDSAGVSGLNVTVRKDTKVFKVGKFIIGCTSSFRMIQLLRFSFHPPKKHEDTDLYQYMCTDFVNALLSCFKDGGFAEINSSVENGGTFLVGVDGRLFTIGDDFQVGESADGFDSVGCGSSFSKGALHILKDQKLSPESKIKIALESAVRFSGGVRPPFVIENEQ